MRTLILAAVMVTVALPAAAQNREAFCELLSPAPAPAVAGADYVPGVDVHGKPVVSADLNAPSNILPDVIRIPVTQDLAQSLNQPLPQGMELKAELGVIEIRRANAVTMNGQDITAQAMTLCGQTPPPETASPAGAEAANHDKPLITAPETPPPPHALKPVDEEIIWGEGY